MRGYAICTQPRSGSNLLCQYLSSTNQLGQPLEYFNGPGRRALGLPGFPDTPLLQIDAILHIGATANGVYGVKLFAEQFGRVSKLVRWTELLPDLRFVYLIRADVLGQAISWARAIQTAQWRSTMQATCLPVYDANLIRAQLLAILRERAEWEAYFARTRIDPLHVIYEQFVEDPIGHVDRIAALMEIDHPTVDPQRVDLVVQRDSLSDEWRWCFQKQCGDRNVFDAI